MGRATPPEQNGRVSHLTEVPTSRNLEGTRTMRRIRLAIIYALAVPASLLIAAPTLASLSSPTTRVMAYGAPSPVTWADSSEPLALGPLLFDAPASVVAGGDAA